MGLPINDSIPRVPEPHAEISVEDEKLLSDLYIRTSWFDAALALDQIEKVSFVVILAARAIRTENGHRDFAKKKWKSKYVSHEYVCAAQECSSGKPSRF